MEAVGPGGAHSIGIALVAGLGVFFIIEKLVLWRHAHSHEHEDPVSREVVAHGVTDALSHDNASADAPPPAAAKPQIAVPAARTAMAFAGNVGEVTLTEAHGVDTDRDERGHAHGSGHLGHSHAGGDQGSARHGHGHTYDLSGGSEGDGARPASGFEAHAHSHSHGHDHNGAQGVLVLIGDSIHNALDGILIAAAFLTSVPLGLVTTLAVAAHEIPHRVGDFALLLHAGMSRQRAMFLNMATGLASVLGGIVAYFGLNKAQQALPYALALAAAGFLYIAVAGLIPGLHRRADPRTSLAQVLLMSIGVAIIAVADSLTRH
jgi:zinc transporter ZupT